MFNEGPAYEEVNWMEQQGRAASDARDYGQQGESKRREELETEYQKKRKVDKELRQAATEPWKNKNIRFEHGFMDFDNAWRIVGNSVRENHHERCSWRTDGLLCDCAVLATAEEVYKQAWVWHEAEASRRENRAVREISEKILAILDYPAEGFPKANKYQSTMSAKLAARRDAASNGKQEGGKGE